MRAGATVSSWGFSYNWGLAQIQARKIEPVEDGKILAGTYGLIPGMIVKRAVDTLLKGLDENTKIPRVDFLKEYGFDTPATGFLTEVDSLTGQRTIVFADVSPQFVAQFPNDVVSPFLGLMTLPINAFVNCTVVESLPVAA